MMLFFGMIGLQLAGAAAAWSGMAGSRVGLAGAIFLTLSSALLVLGGAA